MKKPTQKNSLRKNLIVNHILTLVSRYDHWLLIIGLLVIFLIYAFIQHQRHTHFFTFGWDLAVFDQPIFLLTQGKTPFSSLHNTHTLGDHFHPLLLPVGWLLYQIWPDPRMLLWYQTLTAVFSGLVLYYLTRLVLARVYQNRSKTIVYLLSLSLSLAYLLSVGFQSMVLDDFHDDVLVTLPLMLLFWFVHKKNWLGYWLAIIWVLLTKEEFGLLVVAIGVFLIVTQKAWKQGIATIVVGIATFFILLNLVIPQFAIGTYWQYQYRHYSDTNRPAVVIGRLITQPQLFITTMIDHPLKRQTLLVSLVSFGFLPILAPAWAIPLYESLFLRFVDATTPLRLGFNNHYNGPLIPLLALSSLYGVKQILIWVKAKKWPVHQVGYILTGYLLIVTVTQNVIFHGPINSLFKPQFYQLSQWQRDAQELVNHVPKTGSLATQNFLLPHLSQRENFSLLPQIKNADYIALLLTGSPVDFLSPQPAELKSQVQKLTQSGEYEVFWQNDQGIILRKN